MLCESRGRRLLWIVCLTPSCLLAACVPHLHSSVHLHLPLPLASPHLHSGYGCSEVDGDRVGGIENSSRGAPSQSLADLIELLVVRAGCGRPPCRFSWLVRGLSVRDRAQVSPGGSVCTRVWCALCTRCARARCRAGMVLVWVGASSRGCVVLGVHGTVWAGSSRLVGGPMGAGACVCLGRLCGYHVFRSHFAQAYVEQVPCCFPRVSQVLLCVHWRCRAVVLWRRLVRTS